MKEKEEPKIEVSDFREFNMVYVRYGELEIDIRSTNQELPYLLGACEIMSKKFLKNNKRKGGKYIG